MATTKKRLTVDLSEQTVQLLLRALSIEKDRYKAKLTLQLKDVDETRYQIAEYDRQIEEIVGKSGREEVDGLVKTEWTAVRNGNGKADFAPSNYNSDWPLWRKVEYVLLEVNSCLTSREITKEVERVEPALVAGEGFRKTYARVATVVKQRTKTFRSYGELINGNERILFGLAEWFSQDTGFIKDEHKAKRGTKPL